MTDGFQLTDSGVLIIPDGTAYIKSQQFSENPDIREVFIPDGVRFFEEEIFAECENLEKVRLPEGLVNIGIAAFASCVSLREINIPSTVKTIEDGAFLFCEALSSVTLPDGLEGINQLAFQDTGLEEIIIPASVREIGEEAFFECSRLRRADVLGTQTRIGSDAFGSSYGLIEGFIAPGFPVEKTGPSELLFSLLWASCPDRHGTATCARAESFIRENENLVMERILKFNNIPAMTGIAERRLLSPQCIDASLKTALRDNYTEITALLLKARGSSRTTEGEYDL